MKEVQEIETSFKSNNETNTKSNLGSVIKLIILMVFFALCILLLIFLKTKDLNLNDLLSFFKQRIFSSYSDNVCTVKVDSSEKATFQAFNMGLLSVDVNKIKLYNIQGKEEWTVSENFSDLIVSVEGRYIAVANKTSNTLYVFHDKNKIWSKTLTGEILSVSINKRGYVGVIYKDNGYKNLVKVFNSNGEELLARFYSNNYAIAVRVSSDNKMIAIGELDVSGVKTNSGVRLIPIGREEDSGFFEDDSILAGMEFSDKNLLVLLDNKILSIDYNAGNSSVLNEFGKEDIADIKIVKDKYIIKVIRTGFLNSYSNIEILSNQGVVKGTFNVPLNVLNIDASDDKIAINGRDKVAFYSQSGKQISEYTPTKDVKQVRILKDGTHAAIIYTDGFDIVNIY